MSRYSVIENFKAGLDTRKSVLTSVPGSLVTCENAHVNQGGEVEKRKKFAADATAFNASSFGLEAVSTGFVAFCSVDPAGWTAPTGVTYQRLRHPAALYGGTDYAMESIPFSCNFNGNAFVVAKFADKKSFLYYKGVLIDQSWEGVVLAGREGLAYLGTDLKRAIEREQPSWTVDANANGNGWDWVYSPSGVYQSPVASWASTLGYIALLATAKDQAGTNGTGAYAAILFTTIEAGQTYTVTAPRTKTNTGSYTLANAIPAAATAALTVVAIVAAINSVTSATGYSAYSDGDNLIVFAPAEWGNDGDGVVTITVTWTGSGSSIGAGTWTDVLLVSCENVIGHPNPLPPTGWLAPPFVTSVAIPSPTVNGIHTPFTCAWTAIVNPFNISIAGANTLNPTFSLVMPNGNWYAGTFRLTVTDATPTVVTKDIVVHLLGF